MLYIYLADNNHNRYYNANYADATAIPNSFFGDGAGPYHLSSLGCSGEERTLLDCSYTNQSSISLSSRCRSGNDAGVRCDGKSYIILNAYIRSTLYNAHTLVCCISMASVNLVSLLVLIKVLFAEFSFYLRSSGLFRIYIYGMLLLVLVFSLVQHN